MGCDALYCAGDFSALGAMDAAKQAGLCIPRDFGIVGTANEIFTDLTSPAMSSIEQNPKEMGLRAAEAFLQFAKGIHEDKEIIVEMKLIERESSMRQTLTKQ
jgi:LacI family transcriptional regulator